MKGLSISVFDNPTVICRSLSILRIFAQILYF